MASLDPLTVFAKWKTNTSAASDAWVKGAQDTPLDPTQLAINAIPYMRTRIIDAIDSGRVANGLRRSGKTGWLAGIEGGGKAKFEAGVGAAETKFVNGFTPLLSYIGSKLPTNRALPRTTKAERKAAMDAWFDTMSDYKTTR